MKKSIVFIIVLLCSSTTIFAQLFPNATQQFHTCTHYCAPNSEPRERVFDIEQMYVSVGFEPQKGIVNGSVIHDAKVFRKTVDSAFFDAPGITINVAQLNGRKIPFSISPEGVTVYFKPALRWDEKVKIFFNYTATPRKGIYFIGWNDPTNRAQKQIWTQGQGIDNRYWIPMYDDMNDKMITRTDITFDKSYQVLSNGTLLDVGENSDNTKTWSYTMTKPHSNYLLMIGIGKYDIEKRTTKTGVPVNLYYYAGQKEKIIPTYIYSTECIEFLEEQTGIPYPWESYSQIPVADFIYGAMENTTATIFGDFFQTDARGFLDRNYIGVNVHELTHQWFGDLITGRSAKSTWLQESFATYYPKMFTRKYFGEDHYQWQRRGEQNSAISASEKDLLPIVHPNAGSARFYPKGSAVIDMLNTTFGEDEYKRVINHYLKKHQYKNVETNDLYLAYQDTLGLTPDWFFDQWLYRGGEPHYEVSYEQIVKDQVPVTSISVKQIHFRNETVGLFKMPIVFEIHYTDKTKDSVREWVSNEFTTINIPNKSNKKISFVLFDPSSAIIKKVTFKKPYEMLKNQALNAPNLIDRYDAIEALKSADSANIKETIPFLCSVYFKETFHATKNATLQQVVSQYNIDTYPEVKKVISDALGSKDVEVRKGVLGTFKFVPSFARPAIEKLLVDSSYAIIESTLQLLYENSTKEQMNGYLKTVQGVMGSHNRVDIKRGEIDYYLNKTTPTALVDYTSIGFEFITRQNAMNALKRMNYCDKDVVSNIMNAMFSTNGRLASVASATLKHFSEQPLFKQEIRAVYESMKLEDWQKQMIKPLL